MSRTYHHVPFKHRDKSTRYGVRFVAQWQRWTWLWSEPKEWRKTYKHRKRRAAVRRTRDLIRKGRDPDGLAWPLDKKPWIYYW